jgi:hypothetical protein
LLAETVVCKVWGPSKRADIYNFMQMFQWLHLANAVAGGVVSGDAGEEWRAASARTWSARALNSEGVACC